MKEEKKAQLILIVCDQELRERTPADGFVCPEEYPRQGGEGYYYKIFTHVPMNGMIRRGEMFFRSLQVKFASIHGVDYAVEGITDDRGARAVRLSVQFNRKMKGGALAARLRVFASCLEQAGIYQNVEPCSLLRHTKAHSL